MLFRTWRIYNFKEMSQDFVTRGQKLYFNQSLDSTLDTETKKVNIYREFLTFYEIFNNEKIFDIYICFLNAYNLLLSVCPYTYFIAQLIKGH